jgi:hypothetical protein
VPPREASLMHINTIWAFMCMSATPRAALMHMSTICVLMCMSGAPRAATSLRALPRCPQLTYADAGPVNPAATPS